MKTWLSRVVPLLLFNIVVLLVIGFFTPARVGWAALWAGIVLTALELLIKPLLVRLFVRMARSSASRRTKAGEWVVQTGIVLLVAFLVWITTVLLSGVRVGGWFWGWLLPPVIIAIGWLVYAAIDDRLERAAGELYDRARGTAPDAAASAVPQAEPAPGAATVRTELADGLTPEQRRLLDELG